MNMYEDYVHDFVKKCEAGKRQSPMKAIRARCLDCCSFQYAEVTRCPATDCPLYMFRMGRNETGGPGQKDSEDYVEDAIV